MSDLIESKQAADALGVTEDELNEMRLRGEIHGVRDGSSWKFKSDEIERVAEEKGISPSGGDVTDEDDELDLGGLEPGATSDLELDLEAGEASDAPTAIGTLEAFEAEPTGESGLTLSEEQEDDDTTIGDDDDILVPSESDVLGGLADGSGAGLLSGSDKDVLGVASDSDKDVLGVASGSDKEVLAGSGTGSDVALVPDESGSGLNLVADSSADVLGGSDVRLDTGGTGTGGTGPNLGSGELDFEGSDIGVVSDLSLDDDQDLALGEEEEDELTIGDDEELALDEDDELVLDGGSDVTRGAGDTGINLTSPSDSGLNLEEEPLDLAGSSVSSLELPEDDDIIDLDDLDAGPDEATQLKMDEDFQLAPSAEAEEDDDEDSGSQVIALEDSEAFEQAIPEAAMDAVEPIVGVESDELETALDEGDASSVTKPALPDAALLASRPELPYSVWNVLSLLAITMVLALTGMLMTDVIRNMWSWDSTYTASTPIMDTMIRIFGMEP